MITTEQMREMLALQNQLNAYVNPNWVLANNDWDLAILMECAELVDHLNWKWWKTQPQSPLAQIQLEVVDIWHFILSRAIVEGQTSTLFNHVANNVGRPPSGNADPNQIIRAVKGLATKSAEIIPFLFLLDSCRLSFDDLYRLYVAKATLNLFRWKHGYKDGVYKKIWDGIEDNVYLETVVNESPKFTSESLTARLEQRYQEISA